METVQVQNVNISELREIIAETLRNEIKILKEKQTKTKTTTIYGTRKEVAKELKISLPTLTEYTKNGTLKGYRIGGRVLYKWSEISNSLTEIKSLKYKRGL